MKRILINATQNEEIRVALCKGNHLYDFDLENRTREQKKSNIYKGHVTRVEPSLEAVFVEYGSQRQGFLPIREISAEYLSGNPRDENIKKLIKEGDELIVQVEKEERGNKGAALSTYVSLAGRYLVLMPNNPRGGGISRQISGKLREDMKRMLGNLDLPKGMSVIIRTAGIGKTQEDLQHDLNHLLNIWQAIQEQNQKYPSPRLVHQEAGVVTRAVRDYLRDDIAEIWIDNENAYIEAAGFIDAVMPKQADKLRKYTDYEPMFARFNIEKQIETAYQREVRLPSGGSIVIDQTEALVSIDINSAKSTKGSDVAETAYHTNLEAADEIARQLRLRDMGGLIVIDFIDMNDNKHQKEVEKRLVDATKYDRARVQFGDISKFGLMEMSRQRLRPSLEESTGYICPRCHGNGMIRDLRSLSLSIMREIEQIALKERQGEVQAEVPTDIAAFLLNEKRDSIVYLEQDSGTRITILPHAHLESPNFKLHFNRDGFAPSSYERITDAQQQEHSGLGYDVDWQTAEKERPEQQPTRQPRKAPDSNNVANSPQSASQPHASQSNRPNDSGVSHSNEHRNKNSANKNGSEPTSSTRAVQNNTTQNSQAQSATNQNSSAQNNNDQNAQPAPVAAQSAAQPQAVAWLSNLFSQAPQAQTTASVSSRDAAEAIEALVNTGAQSLGSFGQVDSSVLDRSAAVTAVQTTATPQTGQPTATQKDESQQSDSNNNRQQNRRHNNANNNASNHTAGSNGNNNSADDNATDDNADDRRRRKPRKSRTAKPHQRKDQRDETVNDESNNVASSHATDNDDKSSDNQDKREHDNRRSNNDRNRNNRQDNRQDSDRNNSEHSSADQSDTQTVSTAQTDEQTRSKRKPHTQRSSRGKLERGETLTADSTAKQQQSQAIASQTAASNHKDQTVTRRHQDPNEVTLQVNEARAKLKAPEVVHLSLDDSKSGKAVSKSTDSQLDQRNLAPDDTAKKSEDKHSVQQNENLPAVESATQAVSQTPVDSTVSDTIVSTTEDRVSSADTEVSHVSEASNANDAVDKANDANSEKKTDSQNVSSATANELTVANQQSAVDAIIEEPVAAKTVTASDSTDKADTADSEKVADDAATKAAVNSTENDKVKDSETKDDNAGSANSENVSVEQSNDVKASSETANDSAVELTHEALFAERYVTANKFGQASNDPRVVRSQQAQLPVTQAIAVSEPVVQQTIANAPVIRGTVGEFIRANLLTDAQSRLADDGVIRSFIDAVTAHAQQAKTADMDNEVKADSNVSAAAEVKDTEAKTRFDFSNYGYQPLAADYLTRFDTMTQAVSQFAATQGKTAVEPRAISERASNDPRGQHPDYQAPVESERPVPGEFSPETESESRNESANPEKLNDPINNDLANSDIADTDVTQSETVATDGHELKDGHVENQETESQQVDAKNVEATALTGELQADDISAESEQLLQVDQAYIDNVQPDSASDDLSDVKLDDAQMADSETLKTEPSKEDSQASKSKTTIASYKNMIESVAEQLLQQTGSFNLTTPKVPKSRSRKPKTEHKKSTQAEKVEPDNSDNES